MASTRVFVDDAVLGHLPPVCVKDGIPTSDSLVLTENVGGRTGLGIAWLLLLVGPLGWLGLLILSASRQSGDILTVTLPYSEVAFTRLHETDRVRKQALGVSLVAMLLAFGALLPRTTELRIVAVGLGVIFAVGLVIAVIESIRYDRARVQVDLDASRRWV